MAVEKELGDRLRLAAYKQCFGDEGHQAYTLREYIRRSRNKSERLTVEITALRAELLECKQELDRERQGRQSLAHELENLEDFIEGLGG